MTAEQKKYIEDNMYLVEENRWEEFFKDAPIGLGSILYKADVDFLSVMSRVPVRCFCKDDYLISLRVPSSIKTIDCSAFYYCENLQEIELPSTLEQIADASFHSCKNLKSITLPDSLNYLGESAFFSCRSLKDIYFGKNLKVLHTGAFMYCDSLVSVTLPEGLNVIKKDAFYACNNLKEINIPRTVRKIEHNILRFTSSNLQINFGGSRLEWNRALRDGSIGTPYYCKFIDGTTYKF
jgi:hypothetical protein